MKLETGKFCPLVGGDCKQLQCMWFRAFPVLETKTGAVRDEYDCAIGWVPFLLKDTVHRTEGVGAAVESFRNEVRRQHDELTQIPTAVSRAPRFVPASREPAQIEAVNNDGPKN